MGRRKFTQGFKLEAVTRPYWIDACAAGQDQVSDNRAVVGVALPPFDSH